MKKNLNNSKNTLISIENDISVTKFKIKSYEDELKFMPPNFDVNKRMKQIEADFMRKGLLNQLSLNTEYQTLKFYSQNKHKPFPNIQRSEQIAKLKKNIVKLKKELKTLKEKRHRALKIAESIYIEKPKITHKNENKYSIKKINKDGRKTAQIRSINSPHSSSSSEINSNSSSTTSVKIPWDLISFGESTIIIQYKGNFYSKYNRDCKKYFNEIKSIFKFRNAPDLEVKFSNGKILEIINEEVLYFYLKFLPDCFTLFNKIKNTTTISKWKSYTKSYYRAKLSFLWIKKSLEFLCEFSDNNTPIIPAPEMIKNRNGKEEINHSFIFPLRNQNGNIYLVWESIEESKATYVFNAEDKFEKCTQKLFDFIVSDFVNKRESLITNCEIQKALKFKRRIYHTNYADWKSEINKILGYL